MSEEIYDVIIVGAGIVGASIFRLLNQYRLNILLLDKENDACAGGASKANSAIIHTGYDPKPGTLKAKTNIRGNKLWYRWMPELDIPFVPMPTLIVGIHERDLHVLLELKERGRKNGVPGEIIGEERLHEIEPQISPRAKFALRFEGSGSIGPTRAVYALVGNGVKNGGRYKLNTSVTNIEKVDDIIKVTTNSGVFQAKVLINAAGLGADDLMKVTGENWFTIKPRRGEYFVIDNTAPIKVRNIIFPTPTPISKGILVFTSVAGDVLIGPTSDEVPEEDTSTTHEGLKRVLKGAKKLFDFPFEKYTVMSFAGLRASGPTGDFHIAHSNTIRGMINVAGIESPGFAAAPAIAEMVRDLIGELIDLKEKKDWDPTYKFPPLMRYLSIEERGELIKKDPRYGHIVCRCEHVSEREIIDAIHMIPGAQDVDALKRRLKVTAGRCQGGFCLPRIIDIMAKELNIPPHKVSKFGKGSFYIAGYTKEGDER